MLPARLPNTYTTPARRDGTPSSLTLFPSFYCLPFFLFTLLLWKASRSVSW